MTLVRRNENTNGPLLLVLGIRPDVIRASLMIRFLRDAAPGDFKFVWSGQHYSDNLKDVFFRQLNVGAPDIELGITANTEQEFIGQWIAGLGRVVEEARPRAVAFLGDTNTVLGSIACAVHNIPIVHIEGCMRSYDWRMPEEKYRTVADHLSDLIYAYLDEYKSQGILEGLDAERIVVTGNPIVDVLNEYFLSGQIRMDSSEKASLLAAMDVTVDNYFVMTSHRRENVENVNSLATILRLAQAAGKPVVFPASYRTQKAISRFGLSLPDNIRMIDPIGYVELLELIVSSCGVLTDSGTVVEETAVLGVPSIQMRHSTERPQVYDCGSSVKCDPHMDWLDDELASLVQSAASRKSIGWHHALGDGKASERIANDLILRMSNPDLFVGHQSNRPDRPFFRNLGVGFDDLGDWKTKFLG